MDNRFLTELQLQFLTDKVAEALDEKRKYVIEINGHRRYGAVAYVWQWVYHRTNQRKIECSRNATYGWFSQMPTNSATYPENLSAISTIHERRKSIIKLIVHEIAHFKREERNRNKAKKNGMVPRHKHHTKRFETILQNLLAKIEPKLPMLMQLDLASIQPSPPKPKPTKTEIYGKQLAEVQEHIKQLQTHKKRLETVLKKWRKRVKYITKQLQELEALEVGQKTA